MEQNLAILTSVLAFVFSVVAFFISMRAQKLMALNAELIQKSMFHMDSSTEYEGRLVDWPEAFALYGIDLERAGQEGVSAAEKAPIPDGPQDQRAAEIHPRLRTVCVQSVE